MGAPLLPLHYERNATDPRVQHAFTLEVDDYGTVLRAAAVGYPRRSPAYTEQGKLWVTLAENEVIHRSDQDTWYRIGIPKESRSYELTGLTAPGGGALLSFSTVLAAANAAATISYETAPTTGNQKRLLKQSRAYYFSDALTTALALGTVESKALLHHSESLALTGGLITSVYGSTVTTTMLTTEAGFVAHGSDYWTTSSVPTYDAAHFYLVTKVTEPFGNRAAVTYDAYDLLATAANSSETTPALNLTTTFQNDYRVLAPSQVTDPNDNRAVVAFDELGMVTTVALMGKSGAGEGDTLANPTSTFQYDLTVIPTVAHGFARETHGGTPVWQESYSYTAGNGKEVLRKIQARGGQWIGNGRTVWDNKGNPIKQYEPYFAATGAYDAESAIASTGVTAILRYDPLGRLIRTDLPNGTYSKVVFNPWQQETWDPNDTVLDSQWYATNIALPVGNPNRRAATLAAAHAGTPLIAHADSLGRTFLTRQDNGTSASHVFYDTRVTLDVEGHALAVIDARGNTTLAHTYCPTGTSIQSVSAEAGTSKVFYNIEGVAIRAWNSRSVVTRTTFDAVRRPTHLYVKIGAGTEFLAERTLYGELLTTPKSVNMLGRVYRVYDGAGAATHVKYDFKGNLLESNRVLDANPTVTLDWTPIASALTLTAIELAVTTSGLLGSDTFTTQSTYDALNRVVSSTNVHDGSVTLPTYDESNFLKTVAVKIRGASTATTFVRDITYNARGQRLSIGYAGTSSAAFTTTYAYDPLTFRITGQVTTRVSPAGTLQDFTLVYDPAGNIVEVVDGADQTLYFSGIPPLVGPGQQFEYDAIYRITSASGREHPGQQQPVHLDSPDPPAAVPHRNDLQALRTYTETYQYDQVGNILAMLHSATGNNWNRHYTYAATNNKLQTTELPGDPSGGPYSATYTHDARGNMASMPHLSTIGWDWADRMQTANLGGGGNVYFTYDSSGQRVRKVWQKTGTLRDERIYVGGYEIYRSSTSGTVNTERQTLHVMDDQRRIAMVETLTVGGPVTTRQRFQLGNQLESVGVEVTETGAIIGYEEFYPFGATSFRSIDGALGVSAKRYRYTGKERDEETGLYYHGARYYAAWLGRWTALDPSMNDGLNVYAYVRNQPTSLRDPTGGEGAGPNPSSLVTAAVGAASGMVPPGDVASAARDLYQRLNDASRAAALQRQAQQHATSHENVEPILNKIVSQKRVFFSSGSGQEVKATSPETVERQMEGFTLKPEDAPRIPFGLKDPFYLLSYNIFHSVDPLRAWASNWRPSVESDGRVVESHIQPDYSDAIPLSVNLALAVAGDAPGVLGLEGRGSVSLIDDTTGALKLGGTYSKYRSPDAADILSALVDKNYKALVKDPSLVAKYLSRDEMAAGPALNSANFGKTLEKMVAQDVRESYLHILVPTSRPGEAVADFAGVGEAKGRIFDITTYLQQERHYSRPYGGKVELILYESPRTLGIKWP